MEILKVFSSHQVYIYINKGDGFRAVQLLQDSTVCDISSKHNKSAAQVLLRWGVQNNLGD